MYILYTYMLRTVCRWNEQNVPEACCLNMQAYIYVLTLFCMRQYIQWMGNWSSWTSLTIYSIIIICNIYYSREIHIWYIRPEVNIPPRLYIEAMDRPTVLYILQWVRNRWTFCLQMLPEMTPFCPKVNNDNICDYLAILSTNQSVTIALSGMSKMYLKHAVWTCMHVRTSICMVQ